MKSNDIGRLLSDKKTLERVARSPDAQALAGMLSEGRDGAELKRIAESAARGDTAQLKDLITSITNSPGGSELLRRLGESFGSKPNGK